MTTVERREVPRPTSLGARGWRYQPRKAEPTPPEGCPVEHPGASRRSIDFVYAKQEFRRAARTHVRRENGVVWLFEGVNLCGGEEAS